MASYCVCVNGQQYGPYPVDALMSQGLRPEAMVWTEGMANWQEARTVPELASAMQYSMMQQPPPHPNYPNPNYAQGPAPQPTYGGHYAPQAQVVNVHTTQAAPARITPIFMPTKSVGVAFVLAFFFGPLGMLYSTVVGAVVMILVSILFGAATLGVGFIITWPICIIWACTAASSANTKMMMQMQMYHR